MILQFAKPDAILRRRLMRERWHTDILAGIDLERLVAETEGFHFAEMEETRKLLVMRHLDTGRWDWPWVLSTMRRPQHGRRHGCPIGFHRATGSGQRVCRAAGLTILAVSALPGLATGFAGPGGLGLPPRPVSAYKLGNIIPRNRSRAGDWLIFRAVSA